MTMRRPGTCACHLNVFFSFYFEICAKRYIVLSRLTRQRKVVVFSLAFSSRPGVSAKNRGRRERWGEWDKQQTGDIFLKAS